MKRTIDEKTYSLSLKMSDDVSWEYIPVETAEEVMACSDVPFESNCLKNWNRWMKIRKRQHEHLGLMVTTRNLVNF